jgi:hypothetical protein
MSSSCVQPPIKQQPDLNTSRTGNDDQHAHRLELELELESILSAVVCVVGLDFAPFLLQLLFSPDGWIA